MPNAITNVGFGSPYAAEQMDIQRRQKLAEMLQKQSMEPIQQQQGGMFTPRTSPLQGLAKVMQGYAGMKGQEAATTKQSELAQRMQQDRQQALAQALQQGQGSPQPAPEMGGGPAMPPNPMGAAQTLAGANDPALQQAGIGMVGKQLEDMTPQRPMNPQDMAFKEREHRYTEDFRASESAARRQEQAQRDLQHNEQQASMARLTASLRTPPNPVAPTMSEVIDPKDASRMLRVDARTYKGGTLGDPGVLGVSGKEPVGAKREEKAAEGKDLLKTELDNLREHYRVLNESRAIPSSERGVTSNAAAWVQGSGPGQFLGRVGGTKEQDARNQIQSGRLRIMNAIKNATGMSAQQLNSNIELKTWLDSLTSMTGSYESNVGIIDAIDNAFLKGGGNPKRRSTDRLPDEPPPGAVRPR